MTQNEKRIAIAEKRGWTFHPPSYNNPPFSSQFKAEALLCWVRPGNMCHQLEAPPDYFGSLDACHEMEGVLTLHQLPVYEAILRDISLNEGIASPIRATAQQRCEAFGKALNLW